MKTLSEELSNYRTALNESVLLRDGSPERVMKSHSGDLFVAPDQDAVDAYWDAVRAKNWDFVRECEETWPYYNTPKQRFTGGYVYNDKGVQVKEGFIKSFAVEFAQAVNEDRSRADLLALERQCKYCEGELDEAGDCEDCGATAYDQEQYGEDENHPLASGDNGRTWCGDCGGDDPNCMTCVGTPVVSEGKVIPFEKTEQERNAQKQTLASFGWVPGPQRTRHRIHDAHERFVNSKFPNQIFFLLDDGEWEHEAEGEIFGDGWGSASLTAYLEKNTIPVAESISIGEELSNYRTLLNKFDITK